MTHAAMSSARVMATCALLGEAVGCAANIAREFSLTPHEVYAQKLDLLQQRLMEAGCFLPRFRRTISEITKNAVLTADTEHPDRLRNGMDRNNHTYGPDDNGVFLPIGKPVTYAFDTPTPLSNINLALDSDLDRPRRLVRTAAYHARERCPGQPDHDHAADAAARLSDRSENGIRRHRDPGGRDVQPAPVRQYPGAGQLPRAHICSDRDMGKRRPGYRTRILL